VLLDVAEEAIRGGLVDGVPRLPGTEVLADPLLASPAASFVTLERGEDLLGCIGSLEPTHPLVTGVARHALGAAFADPRLPPVTGNDFVEMSIKVSVLSHLEDLRATSREQLRRDVRPGVDGLVVEAGYRRATLLPAVWYRIPDTEEFLDVLWNKAGLPARAWPPDLSVQRYTTDEFADPGPRVPVTS
jgi:AmmeMemoRadiSam system protein A